MSAPLRPGERDLHALIDDRLDRRRARELQPWLDAEAAQDERLAGWRRGTEALRAAYDPLTLEQPPLFLSLAARAAALPEPAQQSRQARQGARRAGAARTPADRRDATRRLGWMTVSFAAGVVCALLLPAALRRLVDPGQLPVVEGMKAIMGDVVAFLARLLGL